jgi:hypothetical protein
MVFGQDGQIICGSIPGKDKLFKASVENSEKRRLSVRVQNLGSHSTDFYEI